jgi:hypothetical protein
MDKRFSISVGTILILVGALALMLTLGGPVLGLGLFRLWPFGLVRWGLGWLWPMTVVGLGVLIVLPPFLIRGRRSLGGLFIPGLPILTTGALLLLANSFNWWGVWEWLWPQVILALGLGFLFAAIYARRIWLVVPAIIIGLNGLVLQFCALTGLWEAWAVLWTIEPLSVGLALLAVSAKTRSTGLMVVGLIIVGLAGAALIGMTAILSIAAIWPGWRLFNLLGAVIIVLVGAALLVWGVVRYPLAVGST